MSENGKKVPEAELDIRYTVRIESCGCLIRSTERFGNGEKYILFCREHKAAPDMLAALKELTGFLEEFPHQYSIDISGVLSDAKSAIAKATGGGENR